MTARLGSALAYWASHLLLGMAYTDSFASAMYPSPDLKVLAFTPAIAILAGVLLGIVPALYAARIDPIDALKEQSRSGKRGANLFGKALLVLQVALSRMLMLVALLFGPTISGLHSIDVSCRRDHMLTVWLFHQSGVPLSGWLNGPPARGLGLGGAGIFQSGREQREPVECGKQRPMAVYQMFETLTNQDSPLMYVRTSADPQALKIAIEKVIRAQGHHYSLRTMTVEECVDSQIKIQRLTALVSEFSGGVALLIACVGLYSVATTVALIAARRAAVLDATEPRP